MNDNSQKTADYQLAQQLAAYIPATLTHRILHKTLPPLGQGQAIQAATLFADISGFTQMSEELASDGPRGTEELNRVLETTFTAMISIIHDMGGAVSHFYGDAMSVYFPDHQGDAAQRALTCGQQMQQVMAASFSRIVVNRPAGKAHQFALTIKIGVGYGTVRELIVGNSQGELEFALTGTAVDEAALAERHANSGQLIASRAVLAQIDAQETADFTPFTQPQPFLPPRPLLNWQTVTHITAEQLDQMRRFVPDAIEARLANNNDTALAEHRPVSTLFLQFTMRDGDLGSDDLGLMGQQLQTYFEWACRVVARFGRRNARVNRVLTGDKGNQLHIIFGAPVAPDAPAQAIRCALTLLREQPDFIATQQIGLSVGKVFAGPVGSATRREYTVVGDIVNLSARLTAQAQQGEVITDGQTVARISEPILFEKLREVQVKGKLTAVSLHRAIGDQTQPTQLQTFFGQERHPMVGRQAELELLTGSLDTALHNLPSIVAVYGPTGIGKTRLLAEGVTYWQQAGGAGFVGVGQQHIRDIPYGPWRDMWRDFFDLAPDDPLPQQAETIRQRTLALVPDAGDDVGLWADVLGLPMPEAEALQKLSSEIRQARFLSLIRRCFQAEARNKPLLLIIENLQWLDQPSLALLDELASGLTAVPFSLLLTIRTPSNVALNALNSSTCLPIVLSDLSATAAREMLNNLIGVDQLPSAIEQNLGLRDRDGRDSVVNPLFLEEALNVLLGAEVLVQNGRLHVNEQRLSQVQVPDTIHGLLLARIDRLPVIERDLLQIASVIGRQFSLEPLAEINPSTPREMITTLLQDLSAGQKMTQLVTTDPDWIYLFQHAMTHEVAYESLPYARRQRLHEAVANWLLVNHSDNLTPFNAILAYHYSRADIPEMALRYALRAADNASDLFANQEAIDLYTIAENQLTKLGVADHWQTAVSLYLKRGEALRLVGDLGRAFTDAETAETLANQQASEQQQLNSLNLKAEIRYRQASFSDALTLAQAAIQKAQKLADQPALALAFQWAGMAAITLGQPQQALDYLAQAEHICEATNDQPRLARILEAVAFVHYAQKALPNALAAMQRSVALSRSFSPDASIASSLNNIALVQHQLGHGEEALETVSEAVALVREVSKNFLARFLGNRAEILTYLGRFETAVHDFDEAIQLFTSMDDEQGQIELLLTYAYEHHVQLEQWAAAKRQLQTVQTMIGNRRDTYQDESARLELGLGIVALAEGKTAVAQQHLDQALQIAQKYQVSWWLPPILYQQARLAQQQKRPEAARQWLQQASDATETGGCPDYLPLIWCELASFASEAEQLTAVEAALAALQVRARQQDKRRCLEQLGELLVHHPSPKAQLLLATCRTLQAQI